MEKTDDLRQISLNTYEVANQVNDFLSSNFEILSNDILRAFFLSFCFLIVSYIIWLLSKNVLLNIVDKIAKKSKTKLDDFMMKRKVFRTLAHFIPLVFMDSFVNISLINFDKIRLALLNLNNVLIIIVFMVVLLEYLGLLEIY